MGFSDLKFRVIRTTIMNETRPLIVVEGKKKRINYKGLKKWLVPKFYQQFMPYGEFYYVTSFFPTLDPHNEATPLQLNIQEL